MNDILKISLTHGLLKDLPLLFGVGQHVTHAHYGFGKVIQAKGAELRLVDFMRPVELSDEEKAMRTEQTVSLEAFDSLCLWLRVNELTGFDGQANAELELHSLDILDQWLATVPEDLRAQMSRPTDANED